MKTLLLVFLLSGLAFTTVQSFPVDCDSIFDTYTCNDGSCVLSSDRCDGRKDCPDGSDEGASTCADIIGGVIGGVFGFIIFCCVPVIVCFICLVYWAKRRNKRPVLRTRIVPTQPVQTTSYNPPTTPYQPYVPLPQPQGNYPSTQFGGYVFPPPQAQSQLTAPPQLPDAQLFNADTPPSYAAAAAYNMYSPPEVPADNEGCNPDSNSKDTDELAMF